MSVELEQLLKVLVESGWAAGPADRLARGIEERIVASVPSRAKSALGSEEAAQRARVIAWERCRSLAVSRPAGGATRGYLANVVRWRLTDAVRAEALRRERHPVVQVVPDRMDERRPAYLGRYLDLIAAELELAGMPSRTARRLIVLSAEGQRLDRSAIRARLQQAGLPLSQAEGMAWLLRGGAANPSALARLANGQRPDEVFQDRVVRRWLRAAAGLDLAFTGGRKGTTSVIDQFSIADSPGPGLARTA
ncbi:hypothetical protein [Kribbella sp. NPDC051770]|uniref:hypothetical protein n=1 Tax=Kribbella sp. NPDC051770 TaxID=3155413 RepID=UPI00343A6B51